MKVCTDSCLFGACVANKIEQKIISPGNILDIGTGTGLLPLMLSQKANAQTDAVEINKNCFEQAVKNFNASPWSHSIHAILSDIKEWNSETQYDFIISNPPFYEQDLRPIESNKKLAKHDEGLKLNELINCIKKHLNPVGCFSVLVPYHRLSYFENLTTENGFWLSEKILVKQTPAHQYFRGILFFSTFKTNAITNEIIIKNKSGDYTREFARLLCDYYLSV